MNAAPDWTIGMVFVATMARWERMEWNNGGTGDRRALGWSSVFGGGVIFENCGGWTSFFHRGNVRNVSPSDYIDLPRMI